MPNKAAFTQWAMRSTRSNRSIVASPSGAAAEPAPEPAPASGGFVVAAIRPSHPSVHVVAVVLPVARLDLLGDLDRVEPLDRLVPVHRRDVEAHRSAVLVRDVA